MDLANYTERSRTALQIAQSIALASQHQQFTPEHILQALIEDQEGLTLNLLRSSGAQFETIMNDVKTSLSSLPKVQSDQTQIYMAQKTAEVLRNAEQLVEKK